MREIKFIFWDTEERKMYSDHHPIVENSVNDSLSEMSKQKIIPLQFTGLQDINGKDIYEGDICEYVRNEDEKLNNVPIFRGVIKFDIGRFYLDAGNKYYTLGTELDAIKIIGNIYENPELVC